MWDRVSLEEIDPPLAVRLGDIRVPTLVVVGAEDLSDVVACGKRLAREIPGTLHATIEGAAHFPSMEQPDAFNRLLLDFLAETAR